VDLFGFSCVLVLKGKRRLSHKVKDEADDGLRDGGTRDCGQFVAPLSPLTGQAKQLRDQSSQSRNDPLRPRKGRMQVRIRGCIQKKQEIKKERRFDKRSAKRGGVTSYVIRRCSDRSRHCQFALEGARGF